MSKFRSGFESEVSEMLGKDNYEISKLEYEVPAIRRKYTPDFTIKAEDGHNIYIECKGRFREKAEFDKYIHVRDSNPDIDLRFVIQNPKTLMVGRKKKTMKQCLEENGFIVYTLEQLKDIKK